MDTLTCNLGSAMGQIDLIFFWIKNQKLKDFIFWPECSHNKYVVSGGWVSRLQVPVFVFKLEKNTKLVTCKMSTHCPVQFTELLTWLWITGRID